MPKASYRYSFVLTGQDEIDFQTALSKYRQIEIIRLGIKEALKHCPKCPKKLIDKVKSEVCDV